MDPEISSILSSSQTPMMQQWQSCKDSIPDAILFFRLGDFYETFHDDAITASRELDLTLTKRQEIPMAGVPAHICESYIDRLVAKGYKVAIAEQMEDPKNVKGIVKREIVRIITAGTVVTSSLLSDKINNYLACIVQLNHCFGCAFIDITTSEFLVMEFEEKQELYDELSRIQPKEILLSEKWKQEKDFLRECKELFRPMIQFKKEWSFDLRTSLEKLTKHFRVHNLDGFGLKGLNAASIAAGSLLTYIHDDLSLPIDHIQKIHTQRTSSYMSIDRTTQKNLELIQPQHEGHQEATLLFLLDETCTPMGGRLLKQWIVHPLLSIEEIQRRQKIVSHFFQHQHLSDQLSKHLKKVRDLERLMMRIETGFAGPRDLIGLRFSLEEIPEIHQLLVSIELISKEVVHLLNTQEIAQKIQRALVQDPPIRLSDGGIIKDGFHSELDELRSMKKESHDWIARYQLQLRESTKIKTLKIGYTKAFGYYIEISRGAVDRVPEVFQRKQTLINSERYITEELKTFEHRMLTAEERILSLETELFHQLRREVAQHATKVRQIAQILARIDCLLSFGLVAKKRRYSCPTIDESDQFSVVEGRHPVIEANMHAQTFIPNDITLNEKRRLMLITGPNMAGKSTYIRQTALIAIMAQIGSFVPAKQAHLGIIDKVFSRVGASDDLTRGQSTFMVEMTETANILHHATDRSLVILDEIGRGTSTYDGISIAWAVAEHLLTTAGKKPKTLFATHYWELTELEEKIPGVINCHVAIQETKEGIVFLRKIVPGSTDKSYGIHVARLAGLPNSVIRRAENRLLELEQKAGRKIAPKQQQMELFQNKTLDEELRTLDPNLMTPIEALQKLTEWKKKID